MNFDPNIHLYVFNVNKRGIHFHNMFSSSKMRSLAVGFRFRIFFPYPICMQRMYTLFINSLSECIGANEYALYVGVFVVCFFFPLSFMCTAVRLMVVMVGSKQMKKHQIRQTHSECEANRTKKYIACIIQETH